MRKKGLVYRATTLLGLSVIFFQFGGEIMYAKYFRTDRDSEINKVIPRVTIPDVGNPGAGET